MRGYILQIAGGAILAVFADIFSPSGMKKYIGAVTGIILITILLMPIAKIKNIDTDLGFEEFAASAVSDGENIYAELVEREFSERLALDIKERIKSEFKKDVSVEVSVDVSNEGGISKINKIIICGIGEDEKILERISYVYNADEVIMSE